jgi:hypothetical protein
MSSIDFLSPTIHTILEKMIIGFDLEEKYAPCFYQLLKERS